MRIVAAIVLFIECVVVAVLGAIYGVFAFAADGDPAFGLSAAAIALLSAVALGFAVWGVWHGRRWAASLSLTWQILQGAIGVYLVGISPVFGIGMIALAAIGAAATVRVSRPSSRSHPTAT